MNDVKERRETATERKFLNKTKETDKVKEQKDRANGGPHVGSAAGGAVGAAIGSHSLLTGALTGHWSFDCTDMDWAPRGIRRATATVSPPALSLSLCHSSTHPRSLPPTHSFQFYIPSFHPLATKTTTVSTPHPRLSSWQAVYAVAEVPQRRPPQLLCVYHRASLRRDQG